MPTRNRTTQKYSIKNFSQEQLIADYRLVYASRLMSLMGRKEVLGGKAKFGIFGDGKELVQVVMAHYFKNGDFRAGYYRDQTWMLAAGLASIDQLFSQLYADSNPLYEPHSIGRQMNAHFSNRWIDKQGNWLALTQQKNTSADVSCTGGQMARSLGLAMASKKFRNIPELKDDKLSVEGNEVTFVSIGDASTSEGVFWEAINAAAVRQIPLAVFVYDDGYGISVPVELQTTKGSISEALKGFQSDKEGIGIDLYHCKGWDYEAMHQLIGEGIQKVRETHKPAVFHITEITQPQGHSTSGSHERYKSPERLAWEVEHDCLEKYAQWLIANGVLENEAALEELNQNIRDEVTELKNLAWERYRQPIEEKLNELQAIYTQLANEANLADVTTSARENLKKIRIPIYEDLIKSATQTLLNIGNAQVSPSVQELRNWRNNLYQKQKNTYNTYLYSNEKSALNVPAIPATYSSESEVLNGYQILNRFFDITLARNPKVFAFGEDVGQIGDVNQGFAGMQEKYGKERVFDTGIRETSIVGCAEGMAMRGLRPIAEIQYLDYLLYGFQTLSDDIATLHYRSGGQQVAPVIIRTRGHRLEGIWHTGSPMGMMLNALKGMHVLVPRNMVQAVGFYNTLLLSNDPAVVVECLNGYRLKEMLPDNIGEYTTPIGVVEVLQEGTDITLVTYGSCVRIAQEAIEKLAGLGISVELIDAQSLLPFDITHTIGKSLQKTNRLVLLDEDVPGGATAFMLQQIIEVQNGYFQLDSKPLAITANANRSAFGSDGGYFTKPSAEEVIVEIYALMQETDPNRFSDIF